MSKREFIVPHFPSLSRCVCVASYGLEIVPFSHTVPRAAGVRAVPGSLLPAASPQRNKTRRAAIAFLQGEHASAGAAASHHMANRGQVATLVVDWEKSGAATAFREAAAAEPADSIFPVAEVARIKKLKVASRVKTAAIELAAAFVIDGKFRFVSTAAAALKTVFDVAASAQAIGQVKKALLANRKRERDERGTSRGRVRPAAEVVAGGRRKKKKRGRQNKVPEDHRRGLAMWVKCMRMLKFKVPLFMVIQRLVFVAKGGGCKWLDSFANGQPSIKWAKAFVADEQWGLTEKEMRPLDITRWGQEGGGGAGGGGG